MKLQYQYIYNGIKFDNKYKLEFLERYNNKKYFLIKLILTYTEFFVNKINIEEFKDFNFVNTIFFK